MVHLNLSLGARAGDGLLAIFFLVAGIELKREFVAGDLSDHRKGALPIAAAVCGVALPAILFAITATVMSQGASATELNGILRAGRSRRPRTSRSLWRCRPSSPHTFRAGPHRHTPSERAPLLPADPRCRRRPHRHHDHRVLLHG